MPDEGESVADAVSESAGRPDVRPAHPSAGRPERWVAAAAYHHPVAAHIARAKLEFDGFLCYLDNELFVTTAWLYSIATGGVKLMVRESDLAAARESLREKVPHAPEARSVAGGAAADVACPHCGSGDVAPDRPWRRLVVACVTLIAVDGVGLVLLWPLMIGVALRSLAASPWTCASCDHFWWRRARSKAFEVVVRRPGDAAAAPAPVPVLTPPPATAR